MESNDQLSKPVKNNKLNLSVDLRLLVIILLILIVGMLLVWKPWVQSSATDDSRTITVSGEAKVLAEPDEFVFNPVYTFKNANKEAALRELTAKSDEIVKKLKEIGVPENKIKTNSDGYSYPDYLYDKTSNENTYSLSLTIKVDKREQTQKIQDYLVTTSPTGQVSPQPNFSDAKRKELEGKARDEATKDARAKADQSAKNLGFKVGKIKNIQDGAGPGNIDLPFNGQTRDNAEASSKPTSLSVQPGENELTYSVEVVYYIR